MGPRERRRWGVRRGEAPRLINERGDGAPRATAMGVRRGEARSRLRRAPQARPPERSGAGGAPPATALGGPAGRSPPVNKRAGRRGPRERRRWGVRRGEAPRLINEWGNGALR